MFVRTLNIIALVFTLTACSSAAETVVTNTCTSIGCPGVALSAVPAQTSIGLPASSGLTGDVTSAVYNEAAQIFTVSALGVNAQMNRFGTADFRSMLAMRDVAGIHNAYFGQGSETQVVVYSGGIAGNVQNLAGFGRTGPAELPLLGTAQFNGDYAGFTTTRRINGNTQLDVDFKGATINGRITDRIFRQRPDNVADVVNPLSTLVLEETSLGRDGTFQGSTTGGQIVNGQVLWNPASGRFEGLIGGASANEAVGTVNVTHRSPAGGTFEEVGGFLATR